jgi:prepilin-type N-terminal cleavage/methylation domain-containing protein/prepilin-type processing-associated H-X9-DG protein
MRKAFTLIELLVVIAIIALLLAIVTPSLNTAKKSAAGSVCLANLHGLSRAFNTYAQENDSKVARCNQGSNRWVDRPHQLDTLTGERTYTNHDSTVPEKENGIMGGVMFPYTETTKVYHCVADRRSRVDVGSRGKGPYRSYAMPDTIGDAGTYTITSSVTSATYKIKGFVKYTNLINPGTKYIFVEENYTHSPGRLGSLPPDRGYNAGVWSFWRGDVYEAWWDPIAPWHNDRTNLAYADGHAEKLIWKDQRTVKFAYDRMHPDLGSSTFECAYQPGNSDQQYMSRAFPRGR